MKPVTGLPKVTVLNGWSNNSAMEGMFKSKLCYTLYEFDITINENTEKVCVQRGVSVTFPTAHSYGWHCWKGLYLFTNSYNAPFSQTLFIFQIYYTKVF
jgi:hypothetical protein